MKPEKNENKHVVSFPLRFTDKVGPLEADAESVPGRLLLVMPDDDFAFAPYNAENDRLLLDACQQLRAKYPDLRPSPLNWFPMPHRRPKATQYLVREDYKRPCPDGLEPLWDMFMGG